MTCPCCLGVYPATMIEEVHGVRYIRCPLCGDQEFRARFHNPPIDWRLVELRRRTRRQRETHQRYQRQP